jgi:hypothetical protein
MRCEEAGVRRRSLSDDVIKQKTVLWDDYPSSRMSGTATWDRRRLDQFVEMPKFDGVVDMKLFLQRFRTLADYYNWSADERLFRLKQCIQGDAQYMLIDTVGITSVLEFV